MQSLLVPCPAPNSQLCGVLLAPCNTLYPRAQSTLQCRCQGTWLGTDCSTMSHVPRLCCVGTRGKGDQNLHGCGERSCKSQWMPWHSPCTRLQMKATRDVLRVSRDEEQESSGILARVPICLLPCDHHLYMPRAPKAHGCSPAQQSCTNRAKSLQSHLNELHHLLGLCNGDCQLLQLILGISEEFGLLGLQAQRKNTELCPSTQWHGGAWDPSSP